MIKVWKHKAALLAGATALAALAIALAPEVRAQTMSSNSSSFNAGYGRQAGQENSVVDFSTRDANGNRVIVDGVMQTGDDQSVYATGQGGGAWDNYAGVGGRFSSGSASAIGNNLTVVTQGSYNTVIINSTQTNNGTVTANTNLGSGGGVGDTDGN